MTKQSTPHTQTQQNVNPEQSDLENAADTPGASERDLDIYRNMDGAETGTGRSPKKIPETNNHHKVEPAPVAFEGKTTTRTPKGTGQGITSHSSNEESERQEKVVKDRPDAQAGLNHSSAASDE